MKYEELLAKKRRNHATSGFDIELDRLNPLLFHFQKFTVCRSLKLGKSAIFADCGLGKTLMQLEWSKQVASRFGDVLILCPLAVAGQTIQEGQKFGYDVAKFGAKSRDGIYITNYDQLENIDCSKFAGIVLDESSILKNFEGKTKKLILKSFKNTPYKLACTATPSPNDPMEIGNHAEFLDVMTYNEVLAMYFVHDGGDTAKWRLKGHAQGAFYKFISSWALMFASPSDIGFDASGYNLPALNFIEEQIKTESRDNGLLFNDIAVSATNFNQELKLTLVDRLSKVAEIVNTSDENFIIWIKQDAEGEALRKLIPGAVEVKGSDKTEYKESKLLGFANNEFRVLITKSKIAQFGLNYQNCHNQVFAGLDFSFEGLYQSIRRSYRFGQKHEVNIWIVTTDTMQNVINSIKTKQKQFETMQSEMAKHVCADISTEREQLEFDQLKTDWFDIQRGDCVSLIANVPDESVGFSVFSPPFAELYTYSSHIEDMGNSKDYKEFMAQFGFLVKELFRVIQSGRNVAVHCMDLPIQKGKEGLIGLRDFSGMIIEAFSGKRISIEKKIHFMFELFNDCLLESGFTVNMVNALKNDQRSFDKAVDSYAPTFWKNKMIALKNELNSCQDFVYHSRVTIWKDPVVEMQRTKALGLLHKQIKKDSTMSRVGIPDYVLVFRKDGERNNPVPNTDLPVDLWQRYASPVWMDINQSDTLQGFQKARDERDEKHICPLQLPVIERLIHLYTNKGDTVLTPFMGIGSEVYQAVKMGRKGIGFELKRSYFEQAKKNVQSAVLSKAQKMLF